MAKQCSVSCRFPQHQAGVYLCLEALFGNPSARMLLTAALTSCCLSEFYLRAHLEPVEVFEPQPRGSSVPLHIFLDLGFGRVHNLAHLGKEEGILRRKGRGLNIGLRFHLRQPKKSDARK